MAFDPDKYLAETPESTFDPDQYLTDPAAEDEMAKRREAAMEEAQFLGAAVPTEPAPAGPGQLEALGRGAVSGATMGFGEEIGAAALSPFDYLRQLLPGQPEAVEEQLKAQGFTGLEGEQNILEKYRGLRDVAREREAEVQEAHPGTYLAGELVGGIAPAIATGGTAAAGTLAKEGLKAGIKAGAKAGAKFGAAEALGRTEADLTRGEVLETAEDVAKGTVAGAVIGGALPLVGAAGKQAKKGLAKVGNWLDDVSGELGLVTKEAAKMAEAGEQVVSRAALKETSKNIQKQAEKLNNTVSKITKKKAQNLVSESLDSEAKINLTDDVDRFIANLDDNLENLVPNSPEYNTLGNIRAKFSKMKTNLLKEAGEDPSLPTRKEVYEKLLKKKRAIDAETAAGFDQAKAIDNLFDRAAKLKGDWKPDATELQRIQADFGLGNTDDAIEMLRDIQSLKVKRPKINPKTGEVSEITQELKQVLKRADTGIIESDGHLILRKGSQPKGTLPFRPDEITQPVELSPQQVLNLRDEIRDLTMTQAGLPKKVGAEIGEELTEKLKAGVSPEKRAQFEEGMQTYRDIYGLEELVPGISKKTTPEEAGKTIERAQAFIEKEMTDLDPGQKTAVLEEFGQRIRRSVPELGEEFIQEAGYSSKLKELQEIAHKSGALRALGTIEAIGARAGAGYGSAKRLVGEAGKKVNVVQSIADFSADQMRDFAGIARNQGKESVANFLTELANVTSEGKKKALLFVASQKPEIRQFVEESLFAERDDVLGGFLPEIGEE